MKNLKRFNFSLITRTSAFISEKRDTFNKNKMTSKRNCTELHVATKNINLSEIKRLLSLGADVNVKDDLGKTPLHYAVKKNQIDCTEILLKSGARVNALDQGGRTPLHQACIDTSCNEEMIKFLVKRGANVNALNNPERVTPFAQIYDHPSFYPDFVPETLTRFLLKYIDIDKANPRKRCILNLIRPSNTSGKLILEHIAKLEARGVRMHPSLFRKISKEPHLSDYFEKCKEELILAKSTKLNNCWVTFYNLLMDSKRKLKNYAGNEELIEAFENSDCLSKFPIYGSEIVKNLVEKGIERRRLFDEASVALSRFWPLLNPNHLIIRDVLDCLTAKDHVKLTVEV